MTTLPKAELDRIAALVGKMSEGVWEFDGECTVANVDGDRLFHVCGNSTSTDVDDANAAGIVALRNAADALIEMARKGLEK